MKKDKKDILMWAGISSIIMIIIPLLEVTFGKEYTGMIALIFTVLIVNPVYFVVQGIFSGRNIKQLWSIPIVSVVMFLVGAYTIYGMDKGAMIFYAVIYFSMAIISMFTTVFVIKKLK